MVCGSSSCATELLAARRRVRFDDARGQGLRAVRRRLRRAGACGSPQFKARSRVKLAVAQDLPLLKTRCCPNESIRFFSKKLKGNVSVDRVVYEGGNR